ncbi:diacylglycerol/lipid kinase family protein [Halorarius litoreus]|uniref:diacylglycerol/lipid kinase family protein n=1 Tax=Halorarius litoreus TaxID=2962676 RepID=UPI0020CF0B63|nr:diacylglycerol kinase family protein [Halorarius litoreus]
MTDDEHTAFDDSAPPCSTACDSWVVLNPTSGTGDHVGDVRRAADERGYTVRETTHEGHAVTIAEEAAAAGVDRVAVSGGDGTVTEVVDGLTAAAALDDVSLGVLPTGTENLFATALGVTEVTHGFDLLDDGRRRRIDVGFADDRPFVVSCISGIPAAISTAASSDLKERFGSMAFVVAGLRELTDLSDGIGAETITLTPFRSPRSRATPCRRHRALYLRLPLVVQSVRVPVPVARHRDPSTGRSDRPAGVDCRGLFAYWPSPAWVRCGPSDAVQGAAARRDPSRLDCRCPSPLSWADRGPPGTVSGGDGRW